MIQDPAPLLCDNPGFLLLLQAHVASLVVSEFLQAIWVRGRLSTVQVDASLPPTFSSAWALPVSDCGPGEWGHQPDTDASRPTPAP